MKRDELKMLTNKQTNFNNKKKVRIIMNEKEMKEVVDKYNKIKARERRQWTKTRIMIAKAKAAGITVSEAEIDEFIKKHSK
jgi:ribosomal protein S8